MATATRHMKFIHTDGRRVTEPILGIGGFSIVIERNQSAVKIPRLSRPLQEDATSSDHESEYDEIGQLNQLLRDEKSIYRRLGDHPRIVKCFNASDSEPMIEMEIMSKGDLQRFLKGTNVGKTQRLEWLVEIASALVVVHERRVIFGDVSLNNCLLDEKHHIKLSDFGNSTLMELDWDMAGADAQGYSVQTDIGQFGALVYEMSTSEQCDFDLWQDSSSVVATWPQMSSLPTTKGKWLRDVIEKCWRHGFATMTELQAELQAELETAYDDSNTGQ